MDKQTILNIHTGSDLQYFIRYCLYEYTPKFAEFAKFVRLVRIYPKFAATLFMNSTQY